MRMRFRSLIIVVFVHLAAYPSIADPAISPQNPPISTWTNGAGVVAYSIVLITTSDDKAKGKITIQVKNVSTTVLALAVSSNTDRGFDLFTIDSKGVRYPLRNRPSSNQKGSSPHDQLQQLLQVTEAYSGSNQLAQIAPGETILRTINLSTADLVLVKSRLFQCSFSIINPTTSQNYQINSSPEHLIETIIPGSAK